MKTLTFLVILAAQAPIGTFDNAKPAGPDQLRSVGVRGAVDTGGYAAPANIKSQSDLFKELASAQSAVVASLHSCLANLALQYESEGHLDAAVQQFEKLVDKRAAFVQGVAFLFAGDLARASQIFDANSLLLGQGAVAFEAGHPDQALHLFLTAARQNRGVLDPYRFIAVALHTADPVPVLPQLQMLAQQQRAPATAHLAYAVGLIRQGSTAKAERELERALALDSNLADAHFQQAALLATKGNTAKAVQEYERAISIDNTIVEAHYRLSQLYARLGNLDSARRELVLYSQLRDQQRSNVAAAKVPVQVPSASCSEASESSPIANKARTE